MDINAVLTNALWGAVMAGGLAVFFTVPQRALWIAVVCGGAGRGVRSAALQADQGLLRATLLAALAVSLVAVLLAPSQQFSPVVAMSALIPLGAAIDAFDVIWAAMQIPGTSDVTQVTALGADLIANAVTVAAVTLAIAIGFLVPWLVLRFARHTGE
ncbi:MAG: threonine/serine exporter family protein [Thermomicrobiales bacterium]